MAEAGDPRPGTTKAVNTLSTTAAINIEVRPRTNDPDIRAPK
ncbi:MAG TPA: hypothetical protein VFH54_15265 [Mycobacteriales bacterium]|nr:hypothetical protein [Mycobacteriales bacterium]